MRTAPPLQQSCSRELALAAIAEAHQAIGPTDENVAQVGESEGIGYETHRPLEADSAETTEKMPHSMLGSRSFASLLALACVGVAVAAWQSSRGQIASDPISTSSMWVKKKEELQPRSTLTNSGLAAMTKAEFSQPNVQVNSQSSQIVPMAGPTATELTQQIQTIVREITNVEQGIDQLKTEQSQMIRENAELAARLNATQEMVRHNADLTADLKAAQAQMVLETGNLTKQLKTSQDLMAGIAEQLKQSQEQTAHLIASEQPQRPRTRVPPTPTATIANLTRKPVVPPPSPQVGGQTQPKQRKLPASG